MALTRKRALWVATETTYGVDPSADGSGYLAVPCLSLGDLPTARTQLETNYATGREYNTRPIPGLQSGEVTLEVPVIGLSAAAGDGTAASGVTDDWWDLILTHVFGSVRETSGEGADQPDANGITVDAGDPYNVQDLVPLGESGLATQWIKVTADNGTQDYDTAPAQDETYTGAAVAYGAKVYRPVTGGGDTLSLVYKDDDVGTYVLSGARVTALSVQAEVGQIARASMTVRFGERTEDGSGKTALPAALAAPAVTPVVTALSPVWFGGTKYATRMISLDLGLETSPVAATSESNGRSDDTVISMQPTLQIMPLRTDSIAELQRAATSGRLLVQLGGGVLDSGVLNTVCWEAEQAVVTEAAPADDDGRARQSVTLAVTDPIEFSAGVPVHHFQWGRA